MEIIDQIKIKNNVSQNDITIEWRGYSDQIKVAIKYQLEGKTEWADFIDDLQDSKNNMVSFHRELRGERGIYSFLFSCRNMGETAEEIASYRLDYVMLGKSIGISYRKFRKGNLDYLEFIEIEDEKVIPARRLYIEMENKKYPIGIDIEKGSIVAMPFSVEPKLRCIAPYDQMYQFIYKSR